MIKEIFIIGIGGQGALTLGEILSITANLNGYSTTLYPFYGSQMRGGMAGCIVKIDTDGNEITNPTISEPDDFLVLDYKYFDDYKRFVSEKSKIYNLDKINDKNINILLLKKYISETRLFSNEDIKKAIKEKFKKEVVYTKKIEIYDGV